MGADIVAAEGQSLGNALNFGGPYVGLFATREKFVRQMPGRLVGETVDADGRRGWALTLSTREQHIRREKATSNICTNSGLCALAFTIHLSLLGEAGLTRLARLNHATAVTAAERLAAIPGVHLVNRSFFNEFTLRLPRPAAAVVEAAGPAVHSRRHPGQPLLSGPRGTGRSAAGRGDRDRHRGRYRAARRRAQGGVAMNDWSQALSAHTGAAANDAGRVETISGNRGLQIEEKLIFEQDAPGRCGVDLPEPPPVASRLNGLERQDPIGLPGLSEPQVIRHFTRLSQKNYAIDSGLYPLGSCTMKHNPRLNEKIARLPGFADLHPLQPESTVQGALELIDTLAHWLKVLTGMPAVALSPAAGAHGELCGIMAIRAALEARGDHAPPHPGAGIGARHEPGDGRGVRLCGRGDPGQQKRPGRSRRAEGKARPRCRGADADQPEHLRAVRERDHRDRRGGARRRRVLLLRRRQFQRDRRTGAAGRSRHRRAAHQSAQDVFDAAWRRRSGQRPGRAGGRAGALCAVAVGRAWRGRLPADRAPRGRRRGHDRSAQGVSRPDGHVRAGACLHDEPRLGRAAPGRRGRRAQRQLFAREAPGRDDASPFPESACTRCCSTIASSRTPA